MIENSELPNYALIAGKRVDGGGRRLIEHRDPTKGAVQQSFPEVTSADLEAAIATARTAHAEWADYAGSDRRNAMLRLADLIEGAADELAHIGVHENGTPLAFGSLVYGTAPADWFRYYAGWADKIEGRTVPVMPNDSLNYTIHEPFGVVAVLTAFNAPMSFLGMKVAPALAAGNAVVIKPSELAPFSTIRFAELCIEAGMPPGLVNVVTGLGDVGSALVRHQGVDKVTFTGGVSTARSILGDLAPLVRPAVLELGGKSAALLFNDGDLDAAVTTVMQNGVAMLAGQACVAPTRLLVQRDRYDEAVELAGEIAESIQVGDPADTGTLMGPLISASSQERVLNVIQQTVADGAGRLVYGGNRVGGTLAQGFFIEPTIFADVEPSSAVAQHEIFGPVLCIIPFDREEDAIRIANGTKYGLAGYVYTNDISRAHRCAAALRAGYLSINSFNIFPPAAPFGGYGQSGLGREGGQEGLLEMLQTKNVFLPLS